MKTSLFDYSLPSNLIANSPITPRDHSKLMVIDRKTAKIGHKHFFNILDLLNKGDILVLNKTKVFPARFFGKKESGGKVEILLNKVVDKYTWEALAKPGLNKDTQLFFEGFEAKVVKRVNEIHILKFTIPTDKLKKKLDKIGVTPLPPYIKSIDSEPKLRTMYQTVYAKKIGSVAAPTAGFHFTSELMDKLKAKGVIFEYVNLEVGLGTFAPVKADNLEDHKIHSENYFVEAKTVDNLIKYKNKGKRIVAVGTTSLRVLETLAMQNFKNRSGSTNIYIYPPYKFKFVDSLITNFHLPKSTLLALVSAFVSYPNTREKFKSFKKSLMGKAYQKAIKEKYRFYSFGDSSIIL